MRIADCGSTWAKILDLDTGAVTIVPTKDLVRRRDAFFDAATGHAGKTRCRVYHNELIALAEGALALVDEPDFCVVDVGGRDVKYVRFAGRKVAKLDWNLACGSSTGATVELLGGYYGIDFAELAPSAEWVNVTCGVFGMEKVLERIATGSSPEEAVAMFVHGVVRNVRDFAGRPETLYLSGGFCDNHCFMKTIETYCRVTPLGRFVPLEGLRAAIARDEAGTEGDDR